MTTKLSARQEFNTITRRKYSDMRTRSAAKYSKDGKRLLRPAIPMEFSMEEFRAWVTERFGEDGWDSLQCMYNCGRYITLETFVPDHIRALARGGRNRLDNLGACCPTCNDEKGELTGIWYEFLRRCLDQMPADEAQIVHLRLQKSEKLASSVRNLRGAIARQKVNAVPTQQGSDSLGN